MTTQVRLHELFIYDSGKLLRKKAVKGSSLFTEIGTTKPKGYRVAVVDGKMYRVHHLVWMYHHGHFVPELDHINRNRSDNRIENLRPCTHSQNLGNSRARKGNYKGVTFCKQTNKWRAQITIDGVHRCLGRHDTEKDAALAYNDAARNRHGNFEYLNEVT
jgi:hypothetical protein